MLWLYSSLKTLRLVSWMKCLVIAYNRSWSGEPDRDAFFLCLLLHPDFPGVAVVVFPPFTSVNLWWITPVCISALVQCAQLVYQLFLRLVFSCFPGGQVAKLFQDSSLGNAVNIVVTRLILLMEDQVNKLCQLLYCVAQPTSLLSSLYVFLCLSSRHKTLPWPASMSSLFVSNYWLKCLFLHHSRWTPSV